MFITSANEIVSLWSETKAKRPENREYKKKEATYWVKNKL